MSDSAVGLLSSASEHLSPVVEQLLPPPLRYRLVWYSLHHKPPLYIWRAVPPSSSFVGLGMLATSTDEPPPTSAMSCVPKAWCERSSAQPRLVWRDEGQGGRPGALWATAGMGLMHCVPGHEEPTDDGGGWELKEGKITTDTWLLAQ